MSEQRNYRVMALDDDGRGYTVCFRAFPDDAEAEAECIVDNGPEWVTGAAVFVPDSFAPVVSFTR